MQALMYKIPFSKIKNHFILKQGFVIFIATLINALGVNIFLVPHKLIGGGFTGLAVFLNYITSYPIWAYVFLLNAPLFIIALKKLGRPFVLGSLYGMLALSFSLFLTEFTSKWELISSPIMAAVFSGVLRGLGVGLALRVNGSLGGTDIIGALVKKYFSISFGMVALAFNGFIVLLSGVKFGADIAGLALLSIFVESFAIDKTIQGINTSKAVFVISTKSEEIATRIMEKVNRGVTFLEGQGAYYKNPRKVLYCVVSLRQLARVKYHVKDIDADAFMSVADVSEVLGKGFKPSPF